MKKFFHKLLFESPKRGGYSYNKPSKNDLDGDLNKKYKKAKGSSGKEKSYEYRAVKNFLNSRVGQDWDKVYSELSKTAVGYTGLKLKDAIDYLVEKKAYFDEDGVLRDSRGIELVSRYWFWPTFYIHPKTNQLCKSKPKTLSYKKRKIVKKIVELDGKKYYKHDEIWYRVEISQPESFLMLHRWDKVYSDVFYKYQSKNSLIEKYGSFIICIDKQQVNSRICKKLNAKTVHSEKN